MQLRPLHSKLAEKAKDVANETPEKMENNLKELKEWILSQPHINARTDDQFLASFLRGLKFDLESVKYKLDLFYTCRNESTFSEFFNVPHRSSIFNEIIETGCYLPLPKLSGPEARRVVLISPSCFDPKRHSITDVFSAVFIIDKILMVDDDNIMIVGGINLIDFKNVIIQNFFLLNPSQCKKLLVCQQDSLPFHTSINYYINTVAGVDTIINVFMKMFFDDNKPESRAYNENYEDLYNDVPRDILPEEYGGTWGTVNDLIDYWKAKIEEYSDWLEEDLQFGTDESKRIGRSKIDDENIFRSNETAALGPLLDRFLSM